MPKAKEKPLFDPALLDQALEGRRSAADVGELIQQFTKALLERALDAELTHHLGHESRQPAGNESGNIRHGKSKKTLKGEHGQFEIAIPRDRQGSFEPHIVPKHQTRFEGRGRQNLEHVRPRLEYPRHSSAVAGVVRGRSQPHADLASHRRRARRGQGVAK